MNCCKCRIHMLIVPLHRTRPLTQAFAGWTCQQCLQLEYPDLTSDALIRKNLTYKFYETIEN
jgi:hypothetical protein